MPILAVDKFGRIYQTSPDREDGLGIHEYPEACDQQDMTLGNAYLKSEARRNDGVMRNRLQQRMMDAEEAAYEQKMRAEYRSKLRREMLHEAIMAENEELQQNRLRKALQMGCACDYSQGVTGNVMSANGQFGEKGLSRDERTIKHALNPAKYPSNPAFGVDPAEEEQHRNRMAAYQVLQKRSRGISR